MLYAESSDSSEKNTALQLRLIFLNRLLRSLDQKPQASTHQRTTTYHKTYPRAHRLARLPPASQHLHPFPSLVAHHPSVHFRPARPP